MFTLSSSSSGKGGEVMHTKRILGTVTIGQSPRHDLIPEMIPFLGDDVHVIEAGALDGMTLDEVRKLSPEPGDYVLITRMRDGTQVKIAEKHILPRMQEKINELEGKGAQIIALVCTGEFPEFRSSKLLVRPEKVLFNTVSAVGKGMRLGVFIPDKDQMEHAKLRWSRTASSVQVQAASPYGSMAGIVEAAEALKKADVQMGILDCIGYTIADKNMVKEILGVPVILARSIVARTLAELL